jgi:NAD(P)-dependent dehydrogenase (short-subunit alcohol dehydrogenase family)
MGNERAERRWIVLVTGRSVAQAGVDTSLRYPFPFFYFLPLPSLSIFAHPSFFQSSGNTAYNASKAAVKSLTEGLAHSLRERNGGGGGGGVSAHWFV